MKTFTRDLNFVNFNGEEMQWVKFNNVTVYEAWRKLIASGVPPITLQKCKGVDLVDYKIYGNSVQDGTPNDFDKNTYPDESFFLSNVDTIGQSGTLSVSLSVIKSFTLQLEKNTGYKITKTAGQIFRAIGCNEKPVSGGVGVLLAINNTGGTITFNTGDYNYIVVDYWRNSDVISSKEMIQSIVIEKIPTLDTPVEVESVGDKTVNLYGGQSEYTLSKVTNDTHMSFYNAFEIGKKYTLFCYIDNTQGTANAQFRMSVGTTTGWKYHSSNSVATGKEGYSRAVITIPENYNDKLNMQYQVNGGTATFKDIMLVEGSYNVNNLPTYEPYGYKIPVNINRGNLYDKNTIKNGFVPISGTYPTQNSTYPNAQYQTIKLDGGKTYYFTTSVKKDGRIRYADPLTPNISINLIQSSTLNNEYFKTDKVQDNQFNDATFTIKKDVILIIAGLKGLSSYTDLSFKEEPVTTNIYLNEPLRKIGGYADYIDFKNQKVVRNIKESQINNSSSLNKFGSVTDYSVFFIIKNDLLDYGEEYKYNPPVRSNTFEFHPCGIANSNSSWTRNYQISASVTSNYKRMCFTLPNTITDVASAKEWLTENPIDYFYITSEPDDTETIELPNIPTNECTTVIEVDTRILPSNMEVKYYGKE